MRNLINYIIFLVGIWTNLCAQEFELNIDNVNEQYGSFDLLYSSAVDVQGFELNIQGVEIIAANSDIFTTFQVNSEEVKNIDNEHQLNFYSGMFDFSDDGKRAAIFGVQHQNENLTRDSFLGTLSPITGAMITADNATYMYTGIQAQYKFGKIDFTPSFTPGLYDEGDGKDLGHIIEFKSELQFSFNLFENTQLGMSYNHISNASLGEKNPGANSYMFNFLKTF